jgi:CheY-like chemotaxis protein
MPKLLLVEDNEEGRDGLSRHLRRKGYEVLTAADGRQGLEAARAGAPDLILTDMSLPGIDGWEATRAFPGGAGDGAGRRLAPTTCEVSRSAESCHGRQ